MMNDRTRKSSFLSEQRSIILVTALLLAGLAGTALAGSGYGRGHAAAAPALHLLQGYRQIGPLWL